MPTIQVTAAFDDEAGVWFVESSDLFGLNVEAGSVEELIRNVELAAADLLQEADPTAPIDAPIELVARAHARARIADAA